MCHPIVHPLSVCCPAPYSEKGLLEERCRCEEQEAPGSESDREPSPLPRPRPRLHLLETENVSLDFPPARETQTPTSDPPGEVGIPPTALEELALLLTSTGESSAYGHCGNGEELAVELQNYMCILNDAADENWEWEKEWYVCVLMEALLGGLRNEGEGVRIGSASAR